MKNFKTPLLAGCLLWLVAGSAVATVPDGIWEIPEPQGLTFTTMKFDGSQHYVLYHPASRMFFASGNEFYTRASVTTFAYEVWFTATTEPDAPQASYQFWNKYNNSERDLMREDSVFNCFTGEDGQTWVDRVDQDGYSWAVTRVGDAYRLQNVTFIAHYPEYQGTYLGWRGDPADTRLYLIKPAEGSLDWKAVTAASYRSFVASTAYSDYLDGVERYQVAMTLKALLEEAEGIDAAVANQLAVYADVQSTLAQLNAAVYAVQAAIKKRKAELSSMAENASAANPVDLTDQYIKNPRFDDDDVLTGWSGTQFGAANPKENAEHFSTNYNTYQTITRLPAGVYAVGVKAFYRAGLPQVSYDNFINGYPASKYPKLYAKAGSMTREVAIVSPYVSNRTTKIGLPSDGQNEGESLVTYGDEQGNEVVSVIPNNMIAAEYYMHTLGLYDNSVMVILAEGDTLTIGVRKDDLIESDWTIFDDFSLTYYGAGTDAFGLFMQNSTVDEPMDVTDIFLKNPRFEGDNLTTGWSGTQFGSADPRENAEHFGKTFDTYQTIASLPAGIYAVGVKAFYRAGGSTEAMRNYMEDTPQAHYAKFYARSGDVSNEVDIVSICASYRSTQTGHGDESYEIYSDESGNETTRWFPQNMVAAEYYMHNLALYDNSLLIAVAEGQPLTIGVRKSSTVDEDWTLFDDFSLTYYGNASDAVDKYMTEVTDAQSYYNGASVVITRQAGQLAKTFETYGSSNVQRLDITGPLNATDLATLKQMPAIRFLDLSKTTLQPTSLPDEAFAGMDLVSVSLPPAVTSVGRALFRGCSQLAAIQWNTTARVPATALEGVENPNLLFYVQNSSQADGAAQAGIQNIISSNRAQTIVLTDDGTTTNFYCPRSFTAQTISYTHQYGMQTGLNHVTQGWETLSLPFDVQTVTHETNGLLTPFAAGTTDGKPFWLCRLADDGFTPAATIDANVPYIISMPNNDRYGPEYIQAGRVTFSASNTIVPATRPIVARSENSQFKPAFQRIAQADTVYAINKNAPWNSFPAGSVFRPDIREVQPFEAYVTATATAAAARAFIPLFDFFGLETAIADIQLLERKDGNPADSNLYNLQGQRIAAPQRKGIYLYGGKKLIRR